MAATLGANTSRAASSSKNSAGMICAVQKASSMPAPPPAIDSSRLSASSCRPSWRRVTPSATRTAVSCARDEARESRNAATFAHAMTNTAAAAAGSSAPSFCMPRALSGPRPV
jgi:hypothetical protein